MRAKLEAGSDHPMSRYQPIDLMGIARFSNAMAVMLGAGLGVVKALDIVASSDESSRLCLAADQAARNVESGSTLSSSLTRLQGAFEAVFVRMIRAGESCGDLAKVLRGLAEDAERRHRQLAALKGALTYPLSVFGLSICMAGFMAFYMLPRLLGFITELNIELPLMTRILMFLVFNPLVKYGIPVAIASLILVGHHLRHNPERGQAVKDFLRFGLPLVGPANKLMSLSQFCSHLSMMGQSGVVLTEALKILEHGNGNRDLDLAVSRIRQRIFDGDNFSEALASEAVFPRVLSQTVQAAEAGSNLYGELGRLADLLAEEAEGKLDAMLPLVEPLMMGVMGIVVGFVVLATFLPIYQLVSTKL